MVDIVAKIHDKFSLEFKIGLRVNDKVDENSFSVSMWIFVPDSLDLNSKTYKRDIFYRDLRSSVRLITPVFKLEELADNSSAPLLQLKRSINEHSLYGNLDSAEKFEYNVKMFSAIFKSSLRESAKNGDPRKTASDALAALKNYRFLESVVRQKMRQEEKNYFSFGEEFMSNLIVDYLFRNVGAGLKSELKEELEYRERVGFPNPEQENKLKNRDIVFRRGILKKYIESDLFLNAKKKREGIIAEQVYFSVAAGISMIFATAIAFSFQQRYGNFTMPFFVALVVSYMLKDRIKELFRYYFAHKHRSKYFDNKTTFGIGHNQIGWSREGFDFISQSNIPDQVLKIRSRSPLLEADNKYTREKIMLFRKSYMIDKPKTDAHGSYKIEGVNDILRLNMNSFMYKMDNPEISLFYIDKNDEVDKLMANKVYYVNFIVRLRHEDEEYFKRYRVILTRSGILEIEDLY